MAGQNKCFNAIGSEAKIKGTYLFTKRDVSFHQKGRIFSPKGTYLFTKRDVSFSYAKEDYYGRNFLERLAKMNKKTKQGGRKTLTEMNFSYKSSMFLTHELIKKVNIWNSPKKGATKGPEYNSCMLPFTQNIWNIDNARQNTDSLNRMIVRLQNLAPDFVAGTPKIISYGQDS